MKDFKFLSEKVVESDLFSSLPVHSYKGAECLYAHGGRWVHFYHSNLQRPAHTDAVWVFHTFFSRCAQAVSFRESFSLAFLQLCVFHKINPFWLALSKKRLNASVQKMHRCTWLGWPRDGGMQNVLRRLTRLERTENVPYFAPWRRATQNGTSWFKRGQRNGLR